MSRREKTDSTYDGRRVSGRRLHCGSSWDRLLVAPIWPGTSRSTFAASNSCAICYGDFRGNPFTVPPRLDRKNNITLCDDRGRLIGSFRSRKDLNAWFVDRRPVDSTVGPLWRLL